MKRKIAFVGKMGSGKSALTSKFIEVFGATRIALGDPLKRQVIENGLILGDAIIKSRDRRILQLYGQLRRSEFRKFDFHAGTVSIDFGICKVSYINPTDNEVDYEKYLGPCYLDYWIDLLIMKMNTIEARTIINDDIRRLNELNALKEAGFTIIKVNIAEDIRIARLRERDGDIDLATLHDISETEVDSLPYDFVINNNVTLDESWNTLLSVIK